jgi:hypothetical protein
MQNPEEFIDQLMENERKIAEILHHEISSIPGVSCKMRFKIPFYDYKKWLCYLSPQKKGGVELCFINGIKIDPEHKFLDPKKRIMVSGITFLQQKEIDGALVKALVIEAIHFEKQQITNKIKPKNKRIKSST